MMNSLSPVSQLDLGSAIAGDVVTLTYHGASRRGTVEETINGRNGRSLLLAVDRDVEGVPFKRFIFAKVEAFDFQDRQDVECRSIP